jgi:hypothetical protein
MGEGYSRLNGCLIKEYSESLEQGRVVNTWYQHVTDVVDEDLLLAGQVVEDI